MVYVLERADQEARFIEFQPDLYFIRLKVGEGGKVTSLDWVHDRALLEGEDFVKN